MGLTPVEIRHIRLARRPLGYTKAGVDETLTEIADSFEVVWRERADLADKVEHLEAELVRYRGARGAAPDDARVGRALLAGDA